MSFYNPFCPKTHKTQTPHIIKLSWQNEVITQNNKQKSTLYWEVMVSLPKILVDFFFLFSLFF